LTNRYLSREGSLSDVADTETAEARAAMPYTFQELLDRDVQAYGPDLHIHVPKLGGHHRGAFDSVRAPLYNLERE
jgi:hypothetical protein